MRIVLGAQIRSRSRGRPPKKEPDHLRAIAWYDAVATRTGATSSYALEKLFPLDGDHEAQLAEGTLRGSWRKYRLGRLPRRNLIDAVELRYPMTRTWLELPIWELLEIPGPSLERLCQIREMLRPDISELLIEGEDLGRCPSVLFRLLGKADVEAMAGCLLIRRLTDHQLRRRENKHLAAVNGGATSIALRILMYLAVVERPFAAIHVRLFAYVSTQFPRDVGSEKEPPQPPRHAVACLRSIAFILELAELLDPQPAEWRALLSAIETLYMRSPSDLKNLHATLVSQHRTEQLTQTKSLTMVKKLMRAMKKTPRTKSCLDDCLASFASV